MIYIENEFVIDASASEVWQVITDFDNYGDWNSFVSQCESSLVPGEAIKMRVHLLAFPIYQKETVLDYIPEKVFTYGVSLPLMLLKSSRVHFVENINRQKVRYRSEFKLQGLLSPLVKILLGNKLKQGFCSMTEEMKSEILRRQH